MEEQPELEANTIPPRQIALGFVRQGGLLRRRERSTLISHVVAVRNTHGQTYLSPSGIQSWRIAPVLALVAIFAYRASQPDVNLGSGFSQDFLRWASSSSVN